DGVKIGGFGAAIQEFFSDNRYQNHIRKLGINDTIIEQGAIDLLYKECGLDVDSLVETIKKLWNEHS
ncbi:MAG: transketolase C-terminal domain-containing protein, partial [Bacteroidales bacterium]|nr:transketolase C-terminal domain-containing protein [Bacteroidales bacterium]